MNWRELIHQGLVLAAVMLTVATAFTIPHDSQLIRNVREDLEKVRIPRSSGHRWQGFPSQTLGHDSRAKQLAGSQQTNSQQVDYREVKSTDRQTSYPVTRNIHKVKFIDNHRVVRAENQLPKDDESNLGHQSQALSQEVSKSDLVNSIPKMVVVVSTTIAALFGMCVMAAIFQCCCRKKRSTSDSDNGGVVKAEEEEKQKSKSPSPAKESTKGPEPEEKTENDKLLEDDDLGDFSAVQRETEILKSYRRAPPPKNRARASRVPRMKAATPSKETKEEAFSLIKEEEGSVKSKSGSQRSSPEKAAAQEEALTEPAKVEDKRLSFESAKQLVDSMLAEVKEKERNLAEKAEEPVKDTPKEEKVQPSTVNGLQSKPENIFMQIDPTVKIEDPHEKKSRTPIKASSPTASPSSSPGASLRPTSANKDQRKFLVPSVHGDQMDQLVKSLKSKLKEDKSQSARNLATNKVVPSPSDEDFDPKSRERSYSDSAKNLLGIKSTHV